MLIYNDSYYKSIERVIPHIPAPEKLSNRSILITGAGGLICSAVADVLFAMNRKHEANIKIMLAGRSADRMQKRFSAMRPGEDYTFISYDATSPDAELPSADYYIHGAGYGDPITKSTVPVEIMLANITGLNSVLKTAAGCHAKRVLYISSSEIYGQKETPDPYPEDYTGYMDILNPASAYGSCKRAAETLCAAYEKEYDLETVIVRPGHIYGPTISESDSRASAQFTRQVAAGLPIIMKSAGAQLRSYCYMLDCASAILAVLTSGQSGDAYNISNRNSICSIRDLAEALAKAGGVEIGFENPDAVEAQGYNLMANSALTSDKLEALGWRAEYDLNEGCRNTLKFYKK